jgi:hypothetical protein
MAPNTQVLLIGGGAAACALAVIWRTVARHLETSGLNRRLGRDDQPVERARAGNQLISLGLSRSALFILRAMSSESDDRVRLSVALAVAKRQWEPTSARRVRSVRKWASEELELQQRPVVPFGPAVTRLADMGGPRQAQWTGPKPTPTSPDAPTVPSPAVPATEQTPEPAPNGANGDRGTIRWVAPSANEPSG